MQHFVVNMFYFKTPDITANISCPSYRDRVHQCVCIRCQNRLSFDCTTFLSVYLITENNGEPPRYTGNNREKPRTTENHQDTLRTTEKHREQPRTTPRTSLSMKQSRTNSLTLSGARSVQWTQRMFCFLFALVALLNDCSPVMSVNKNLATHACSDKWKVPLFRRELSQIYPFVSKIKEIWGLKSHPFCIKRGG